LVGGSTATRLTATLALPAGTDLKASLKTLADQAGVSPLQFAQRVQRAVAASTPGNASDHDNATPGWLAAISDQILTALLVYGYPVLGRTLLFGAIGLPLPDGIATTIAGSLAAQGRMSWIWAGLVAVGASVIGDAVGYGLGRVLGREVIERRGWFGFTAARRTRVETLFVQWGSLTVFITRTFVSYLSSIANLFAGMSRYGIMRFLVVAAAGRVVWTAAYLGLGYGIGADWEAATGFLTNLSGFLVSATALAASGLIASGRLPAHSSSNGSPT
jgi:membrane protein DedA with SNARE-associated domain